MEHIFPESIGGKLTTRRVCKACNDKLGHSVDAALTEHTLVGLARAQLGIAGKTGRVPEPLGSGYIEDDPQQKVTYRVAKGANQPQLRRVPSVVTTTPSNGRAKLSVRLDKADSAKLPGIVNKAIARAGGKQLSAEEILAATTHTRVENPTLTVPFNIEVNHFRRAIAKIAYELACLWLGEQYLDDPTAVILRQFIFDTELTLQSAYSLFGDFRLAKKPYLLPFWDSSPHDLIGLSTTKADNIAIYVRVLGVFEASLRVTERASQYALETDMFVAIDPTTGAMRHWTFTEEADRIQNLPK